jgi:hypothetical protein
MTSNCPSQIGKEPHATTLSFANIDPRSRNSSKVKTIPGLKEALAGKTVNTLWSI